MTDAGHRGAQSSQQDPAAGHAGAGRQHRPPLGRGRLEPPVRRTVPNVVGQKASAARATLVGAKLTVKTVYKKGKIGIVLAETPTGSVPAYTQITHHRR